MVQAGMPTPREFMVRVVGPTTVVSGAAATLVQQNDATREAAEFLDRVHERTRSNEESARVLGTATDELLRQAGDLRDTIRRFSL